MYCERCGSSVSAGDSFCLRCGASLVGPRPQVPHPTAGPNAHSGVPRLPQIGPRAKRLFKRTAIAGLIMLGVLIIFATLGVPYALKQIAHEQEVDQRAGIITNAIPVRVRLFVGSPQEQVMGGSDLIEYDGEPRLIVSRETGVWSYDRIEDISVSVAGMSKWKPYCVEVPSNMSLVGDAQLVDLARQRGLIIGCPAIKPIPSELWGTWVVRRVLDTGGAADWTGDEAAHLIGTEIEYSANRLRWDTTTVDNLGATATPFDAQKFAQYYWGSAGGVDFNQLGINASSIEEIGIKHRDLLVDYGPGVKGEFVVAGDSVLMKDPNTILFTVEGTWFEAQRVPQGSPESK